MKQLKKEKFSPSELESHVAELLNKSLGNLGFTIDFSDANPTKRAPDFLAKKLLKSKKNYRIAIELKGSRNIRDAIKYGVTTLKNANSEKKFDKLLLILFNRNINANELELRTLSNDLEFRDSKWNLTNIEIIDLNGLNDWVNNLKDQVSDEDKDEVIFLIRQISREFISLIAKNPEYLMSLEWRDLERTIAELFNEIGFNATLTPGSKDGGKDIILECEINNEKKSFIVELKHWRSKQKVGKKAVKEFTQVIINEKRSKGLYLSTYGYSNNYFESLTKVERSKIRFGEKEKIVELCSTYEKMKNGIWLPVDNLEDLLFENTN